MKLTNFIEGMGTILCWFFATAIATAMAYGVCKLYTIVIEWLWRGIF